MRLPLAMSTIEQATGEASNITHHRSPWGAARSRLGGTSWNPGPAETPAPAHVAACGGEVTGPTRDVGGAEGLPGGAGAQRPVEVRRADTQRDGRGVVLDGPGDGLARVERGRRAQQFGVAPRL